MANSRVAGDGNTRLRRLGQTLAGPSPDRQPESALESPLDRQPESALESPLDRQPESALESPLDRQPESALESPLDRQPESALESPLDRQPESALESPLDRQPESALESPLEGDVPSETPTEARQRPKPPSEPLGYPKPFPAPPAPPGEVSRPSPIVTPPATRPIPQPHQPHLLTATVDGVARTLSLTRWADLLGVDRSTLAYRLRHGWPTREILGLDPRRRDRGAEQAHSAALHARVLVVEDVPDGAGGMVTRVVPRQEAAARLGILPASLTHRLRDYRAPDGSSAQVSLQELATRRTPP